MFNKVILVGNLTRDIELRYAQSGSAIANTAIATSRKYTSNGVQKEDVCFIDITAFGRSAEIMNQYLRKGSKILVEGRLNLDTWQDQNTGQNRHKHTVIVESFKMLDSAPQQGGQAQQPAAAQQPQMQQQQAQQPVQQPAPVQQPPVQQAAPVQQPPVQPAVQDINEDEIPF